MHCIGEHFFLSTCEWNLLNNSIEMMLRERGKKDNRMRTRADLTGCDVLGYFLDV